MVYDKNNVKRESGHQVMSGKEGKLHTLGFLNLMQAMISSSFIHLAAAVLFTYATPTLKTKQNMNFNYW